MKQAKLRRAEPPEGRVAGLGLHDLRTPLTTIKALAHDLRLKGSDGAAVIEEEADRLNRAVADLLDLSRLQSGALAVQPELIAAEDLLGAALQRVSGTQMGREIRACLRGGDPILVGRFDFAHALRALVNLLENALKYSSSGSPVEVLVERRGNRLGFAVRDRGPGVALEDRERIFEPFWRSSPRGGTTAGGRPGARHRPAAGRGAGWERRLPAPRGRRQRVHAAPARGRARRGRSGRALFMIP